MIKLAAEKTINKFTRPVISSKGNGIKYPNTFKTNSWTFLCLKGPLGPRHYMILDILATIMIHQIYNIEQMNQNNGEIDFNWNIPTSNHSIVKEGSSLFVSREMLVYLRKLIEGEDVIPSYLYADDAKLSDVIKDCKYDRFKRPITIVFTDGMLKKHLPFLKKYSSVRLKDLIVETSNIVVCMNFPVRYFEEEKYHNFKHDNDDVDSTFFTIDSIEDCKHSQNGRVLERKYQISFATRLGYFFVQNCMSAYTDLLPSRFYLMTDFAQLFYRLLILPFFGDIKNPLHLTYIKNRLWFKTRDTYMIRQVIKRIMSELEANTLIGEPRELKKDGQYVYSYIRTPWKDISEC